VRLVPHIGPIPRPEKRKRIPPRHPRRAISPATNAQRSLIHGQVCIVCAREPCDPCHLIDRSLAPSWGDDPRMVIALCRAHHDSYDRHELDLSPYLEPYHRDAIAVAIEAVGLFRALNRITGMDWVPVEEAA
jgi:hypothetical protein